MGKETTGEGEEAPGGPQTASTPPANDSDARTTDNDKGEKRDAIVHLLDASAVLFAVSKKANGSELFKQVVEHVKLNEKDYFALSFTDHAGNKIWLYDGKRIAKQLKGRPWEFSFEVKFYPPDPASLTDDLTRYQLCLQVRRDIQSGKIPATLAAHALLGSFLAQSERGDYDYSPEYEDYLRGCGLAPSVTPQLLERLQLLHKLHKGETPAEADLHYLENAAKLSMYGVHLFPAKDSKGMPVQIGVCAHGINVYRDHIRIHRFVWQNIIKIVYSRNTFTIKLRPGELERNETSISFKSPDFGAAKRTWKSAVEHHTFFRLMQPDEKPRKGIFRFGSGRFRYQGRTQFQSKMASQMFDRPAPAVQRSHSARLGSRSDDEVITKAPEVQTSPLHFADDGTSRDLNSPEKSYSVRQVDGPSQKEKKKVAMGSEAESGKGSPEKKEVKKKDKKKKKKRTVKSGGGSQSSSASESEGVHESSTSASGEPKEINGSPRVESALYKEPSPSGDQAVSEQLQKVEPADSSKLATTSPTIEHLQSSSPHTTFESWHETTVGPESVVTDVDQHGNIVKRTVKTQQVKHTVQRQTYQTYTVPTEDGEPGVQTIEASQQLITPVGESAITGGTAPLLESRSHAVAYESPQEPLPENGFDLSVPGELVSSRTITSGNRTVETITYKTEKDGIVETHVEHRVTIHSGEEIDHDAELSHAIMEATDLNPGMTVEKIEVKQELLS